MESILVIGATGRVGRQVLSQLPASGVRIRALVRNPDTAALPSHVEVVRGDLTVVDTLDAALDDVDRVFLVWTAPPASVGAALDRIAKHARRIVFLSAPLKTPHPFFQQANPLQSLAMEIERRIEASGLEWTFLRPGMFASNALLWWAPLIRSGVTVVRWPYAGVPTAPIDPRDIAAVAVRALSEKGHAGAEYVLTGPESLTQAEQVETIGSVIGRPLRMESISPDQARQELLHVLPLFVLNLLISAWGAGEGLPAWMTSTVEDVTGVPARPFRQWVSDHAAQFRA